MKYVLGFLRTVAHPFYPLRVARFMVAMWSLVALSSLVTAGLSVAYGHQLTVVSDLCFGAFDVFMLRGAYFALQDAKRRKEREAWLARMYAEWS